MTAYVKNKQFFFLYPKRKTPIYLKNICTGAGD
jgi:hypothetical protein